MPEHVARLFHLYLHSFQLFVTILQIFYFIIQTILLYSIVLYVVLWYIYISCKNCAIFRRYHSFF